MSKNVIYSFFISFLLSLSAAGAEELETGANRNGFSILPVRGQPNQVYTSTNKQQSQSGMGRVVLEKNMVNGINLLIQSMFIKQNTIYVIKYDFDLNRGYVNIPTDCVLQFDGGSISNGTIIGQDSEIQAGLVKIFGTNVTLAGSWKNNGHIRWFGANPGNKDNTTAIQRCLDNFEVVEIDNATYKTDALSMTKCRVLRGIKAPRGETSCLSFSFGSKVKSGITVIYNSSYPYVEIEGVSFILHGKTLIKGSVAIDLSASTSGETNHYSVPIKCNGCMFSDFETGIKSNFKSYYNYVDNCVFKNVNQCLRDFSSNNLIITKTYASCFSYFAYGIIGNGPFTLRECSFELFTGGIVFSNVGDVGVVNFFDNYVETVKGNIFQGFCSSLVSIGNSIQMDNDADSLYYPYNNVSFISTGNLIKNNDGFRVNSTTGKYDFKYYKYYNTGNSKLKNFVSQDVVQINSKFDKKKYSGDLNLPLKGNNVAVMGYDPFSGNMLITN